MKRFKDKNAKAIFNDEAVKTLPASIHQRARTCLQRVGAATAIDELRIPSSHRLKALQGDRKGQYSIRINDQYRVCFVWDNGTAWEIEITDYH